MELNPGLGHTDAEKMNKRLKFIEAGYITNDGSDPAPDIPEESIDESGTLNSTEVFGRTTSTFFDAPPSSNSSYVNSIILGYSSSRSFDYLTFTSLDSANGSLSRHNHYGD
jgi:hypothetical protein